MDVQYHIFISKNSQSRKKIYYFELPGCIEKPDMTFKKDKQILTLKLKDEMKLPKGYKFNEGEGQKNSMMQITIKDEYGSYECDKEFTKVENGLLKMKFHIMEDFVDL